MKHYDLLSMMGAAVNLAQSFGTISLYMLADISVGLLLKKSNKLLIIHYSFQK